MPEERDLDIHFGENVRYYILFSRTFYTFTYSLMAAGGQSSQRRVGGWWGWFRLGIVK
jgi:hypothetical protein